MFCVRAIVVCVYKCLIIIVAAVVTTDLITCRVTMEGIFQPLTDSCEGDTETLKALY